MYRLKEEGCGQWEVGGWVFGHGLNRRTRATGARQPSLIICRWLWIRSGSGPALWGPHPLGALASGLLSPSVMPSDAIIPSGCLFVCLFVVSSVASLHFALVKHFKSHKSRPQQKQKDPLSPWAGHPIHYTISAGLAFASVIEIKLLPN